MIKPTTKITSSPERWRDRETWLMIIAIVMPYLLLGGCYASNTHPRVLLCMTYWAIAVWYIVHLLREKRDQREPRAQSSDMESRQVGFGTSTEDQCALPGADGVTPKSRRFGAGKDIVPGRDRDRRPASPRRARKRC
jgi:hypothetical protein